MREVKFRAWHKLEGKIYQWGSGVIAIDHQLNVETVPAGRTLKHDEVELMQFTGMFDCNGNDIYEGDILQIEDASAKVVFWERPPEFGLDFSHNEDVWCEDWNLTDDSERMAIIGNIYENPDLLSTQ